MELNLLIKDIPIYVLTCKFKMLICKSAQVIKYYVMFAFLFVQTVHLKILTKYAYNFNKGVTYMYIQYIIMVITDYDPTSMR